MLYWSNNGFAVWMKRLEVDTFCWPESEAEVMEVTQTALSWLLNGLDLTQAHRQLEYCSVV
nr:transposase [Desulfomarina profundi]